MVVSLLLWPSVASAAEDGSSVTWAVRPADAQGADGRVTVDHEVDAGASITEHIEVRNFSQQEVVFTLSAADGYFTDNDRFNMLTQNEPSTDAGAWVTVPGAVSVPAGEARVVLYTVDVPADATPGDHLAGVAASVFTDGSDAGGEQVGIEGRVGVPITLHVPGEWRTAVSSQVVASYHDVPNPFSPGSVLVDYSITNEGNSILMIEGAMTAAGPFGVLPTHVPITTIERLAPGESRSGTVSLRGVWPTGATFVELHTSAKPIEGESTSSTAARTEVMIAAMPWAQLLAVVTGTLLTLAWFLDRRHQRLRFEKALAEASSIPLDG